LQNLISLVIDFLLQIVFREQKHMDENDRIRKLYALMVWYTLINK